MTLQHGAHEWLEYADNDYRAAKVLSAESPKPYEIIAFHYQQAAEKYLKAVLAYAGDDIPYIHDLVRLNGLARNHAPELENVETVCHQLTPFGTTARYPGSPIQADDEILSVLCCGVDQLREIVKRSLGVSDE